MSVSEPFIRRPVATALLMVGLLLAGLAGYRQLPGGCAAPGGLPDHPRLDAAPGGERRDDGLGGDDAARAPVRADALAGPDDLACRASAAPRSRSSSTLDRNIDAAEQDVQAAINAAVEPAAARRCPPRPPTARATRPTRPSSPWPSAPTTLPARPGGRLRRLHPGPEDLAGVWRGPGHHQRRSEAAVRVQVDPAALAGSGLSLEDVRAGAGRGQREPAQGQHRRPTPGLHPRHQRSALQGGEPSGPSSSPTSNGAPIRLAGRGRASSTASRTTSWRAGPDDSARPSS